MSGERWVCEPSVYKLSLCLQEDLWQGPVVLQKDHVRHPPGALQEQQGWGWWQQVAVQGTGTRTPRKGMSALAWKAQERVWRWRAWVTKVSEGVRRWKTWIKSASVREREEEWAVGQGRWHHVLASFLLEELVWFRAVIPGGRNTRVFEGDSAEAVGASLSSGRFCLVFSQVEKSG